MDRGRSVTHESRTPKAREPKQEPPEPEPVTGGSHRRQNRILAALATACISFAAAPAFATTGELVLVPDFTGKLPALIALFAALIWPANQLLFKPIFKVLDERAEKTEGRRQRAARIMHDAEETLANYESAIREVRGESERDRKEFIANARTQNASVTAEARGDAEREVERARESLAAALTEARGALREQAESLATEAASRVLGRPL